MLLDDLKTVGLLRSRLLSFEEAMEYQKSALERCTAVLDAVGTRGNRINDKIGNGLAKLEEMQMDFAVQMIEYEQQIANVRMRLLKSSLTEYEMLVVWFRYVENLAWDEVCNKTAFSKSHCFNMHRSSIKKLCY